MALLANSLPYRLINGFCFVKIMNPPFSTDSHPCIRIGAPVDCIGGPVDLEARGRQPRQRKHICLEFIICLI